MLALAGCADPVREPFDGSPILAPPTSVGDVGTGVVVTPFEGLPPDQAGALQTELIKAMRRRDVVAAAVNPAPASSLVRGGTLPGPNGATLIDAELVAPSGLIQTEVRVPADGIDRPERRIDLAERLAAGLLGAGVSAPAPSETVDPAPGPAAERRWRVRVAPVTGAPGDGRTALTTAMARALARSGLDVTQAADADVLVLHGEVALGPATGATQPISLRWRVDDPAGRDLGRVSQDNQIPAGSLDARWGPVADLAAAAAADGVRDLIAKLPPPGAAAAATPRP